MHQFGCAAVEGNGFHGRNANGGRVARHPSVSLRSLCDSLTRTNATEELIHLQMICDKLKAANPKLNLGHAVCSTKGNSFSTYNHQRRRRIFLSAERHSSCAALAGSFFSDGKLICQLANLAKSRQSLDGKV